jgi:acetylornithine deacetylase
VNPGTAQFACDLRTLPGMTEESIVADLNAFLDDAMADDAELRAELEFELMVDACEVTPDEPIVIALQAAAAEVLDDPPRLDAFPGATDAPHFQLTAGIPTVAAFGPGMLPRAHSPNEYMAVAGIAEAARIYTLATLDYLDSP